MSGEEFRRVRAQFDEYEGMEVDSVGRSGGLAFLWKKHVRCVFRSASVHHMDFEIQETEGNWRVTGFYGWQNVADRHLSWELLRELGAQYGGPWVCIGDFNEILFATEMKGGTRPQRQMNNFREAVDDCGLRDIEFEGYAFTYDNGQSEDDNRQCRLGRALSNDEWAELFPRAKLIHLAREWSDHAPILLKLARRVVEERFTGKKFRFEQVWIGEEGCEEAVRQAWEVGNDDLVNLMERCANNLQKWKGISIGKIVKDLNSKRRKLTKLNEGGRSRREVEERKKWKAGQRRECNHIDRIVDEDGRVKEGLEAITGVAKNYFKKLFTTGEPRDFEHLLDGIEGRVTDRMNYMLRCEYSEEEVTAALNQMHPLKAPGPDGMNGLFYQTYWHIVGPAVVRTVLRVLRGAPFPEGGKYFANGSFMAATLGTTPSFTWRGILEAREVLKLGARKRIGDGLSTLVWLDPWIPGT
ncbi:uncharacterized protein LOC141632558 [Silene latifolia]|uniref:uncharacterized protein LOC141632558 n=1 Tax=Silene latifolia TaxID=37657 RepID=UPI003D76BD1F